MIENAESIIHLRLILNRSLCETEKSENSEKQEDNFVARKSSHTKIKNQRMTSLCNVQFDLEM